MAPMVRKQFYVTAAQNGKLKELARQRRVTEAELVREAIDNLPPAEDPVIARLRAKGLIAPKPPLPEFLQGKDLDVVEAELWAQLGDLGGVTLSDAVLQERAESPY
jgi:ribbon-helix-helix protein